MVRIVHMGKLGGYAALLGGALLELDGRILWPSVKTLTDAAQRAGIGVCDQILDTRSVTDGATTAAAPLSGGAEPRQPLPMADRRAAGLPLAA
ncbi:hypothetical protein TSO352_20815 [Azospirillum sp. TSO35-2]|nr:hypothetical protein TSO352_20815 [Azospirillum sp. TSO35-2]